MPDGRMYLRDGRLDIDWRTRDESEEYFRRLRDAARDIASALGGQLDDNPLSFLRRALTLHLLGGAPMGRHSGEGVVDSYGNASPTPACTSPTAR